MDLGFGHPVDWFPEDDDDIESTSAFYNFMAHLVWQGYKFDLIDLLEQSGPECIRQLVVSLSEVPRESFRFFENYRFEIVP